jgi:hypothetical protein
MKTLLKNIVLFIVFGAIYFGIECLWKGHLTHWSMFVLAGFIGVLIGSINEYISWEVPFWRQCVEGMVLSVMGEAAVGAIVNIKLGLNVWHYEVLPFFWGQCSVPFAVAWLFLSGICIIIDDYIRWKWFGEEEPYYTWR